MPVVLLPVSISPILEFMSLANTGIYTLRRSGLMLLMLFFHEQILAGVSLFADNLLIDLGSHFDDEELRYELVLDNPTDQPVEKLLVETSCGCTGVDVLTDRVAPHSSVTAFISIDLLGKRREIRKTLDITFEHRGQQYIQQIDLTFVAKKRVTGHEGRSLQQSLFKAECASCHARPARGRSGKELFAAVCGQCHGVQAEGATAMGFNRLSYLKNLDTDKFRDVTRNGLADQQYMPGFAGNMVGHSQMSRLTHSSTILVANALSGTIC